MDPKYVLQDYKFKQGGEFISHDGSFTTHYVIERLK